MVGFSWSRFFVGGSFACGSRFFFNSCQESWCYRVALHCLGLRLSGFKGTGTDRFPISWRGQAGRQARILFSLCMICMLVMYVSRIVCFSGVPCVHIGESFVFGVRVVFLWARGGGSLLFLLFFEGVVVFFFFFIFLLLKYLMHTSSSSWWFYFSSASPFSA